MRAAAQHQRPDAQLLVSAAFGGRKRLRTQRDRVARRVPPHGVLGGERPGPPCPGPVTGGRGVPGKHLGLAGQKVGGTAMVGEPGRFRRGRVHDLADQVIGELVVAATDDEQPGLERLLAQIEHRGVRQVEQLG